MNFVQSSLDSVSYDARFRRNLVRICKKSILHIPDRQDIKDFLHQSSQLVFLKTDECLEDTEREFLKTFYLNNENVFLITYQLWQKYDSSFCCLDEDTIRLSLFYKTNKVKKMVNLIKELNFLHAEVTVLSKTFF